MSTVQTIYATYAGPSPWTIWAVVPLPLTVDITTLAVLDADGTPRWVQAQEVSRTRTWRKVEVCALLQGKRSDKTYTVTDGNALEYPSLAENLDAEAYSVANGAGTRFVAYAADGSVLRSLALTTRAAHFYRYGPRRLTWAWKHDLGALGGLQVWLDLLAGERSMALTVQWHNASLPAQPDAYFGWAEICPPHGWDIVPLHADPSVTSTDNCRIAQKPDRESHILPQRSARPFRLIMHRTGEDALPAVPLKTWGVGSWTAGGFGVSGLKLPTIDRAKAQAEVRARHALAVGNLEMLIDSQGRISPDEFWPTQGAFSGDEFGADAQYIAEGALEAAAGVPEGIVSLMIESLRVQARSHLAIFERGGLPIEVDRYVAADKSRPWRAGANAQFLLVDGAKQDEPFGFSRVPKSSGTCAYEHGIRAYDPIDLEHFPRLWKSSAALVELTNDPLSRRTIETYAEVLRLSIYEADDGLGGWKSYPHVDGLGHVLGAAEACGAILIATRLAMSAGQAHVQVRLKPWLKAIAVEHAVRAQMVNGGIQESTTFGPVKVSPFNIGATPDYGGAMTSDEALWAVALKCVDQVLDDVDLATTSQGPLTRPVFTDRRKKHAAYMWSYAWKPGTTGVYYPSVAVGAAFTPIRYVSRGHWPGVLGSRMQMALTSNQFAAQWAAFVHDAGQTSDAISAALAMTSSVAAARARTELEKDIFRDYPLKCQLLAILQGMP